MIASRIPLGLFILCMALCACEKGDSKFRNDFRWLSGQWEGMDNDIKVIERWKWNKHRFEGEAFNIKDGDTLVAEQIYLSNFGDTPGYVVKVNGRGPLLFGLVQREGMAFDFRNEDHDFPSIIRYHKDSDSSLTVSLMSKESPDVANISYQLRRVSR